MTPAPHASGAVRGREQAAALLMAMVILVASTTGGVAPVPELGFVLQLSGVGALTGGLIASLMRRSDPEADVWWITTRMTLLGALVGALIVLADVVAL